MDTAPDERPDTDRLGRAFGTWILNADQDTYKNIGMRRIGAVWLAGWDAARRVHEAEQAVADGRASWLPRLREVGAER